MLRMDMGERKRKEPNTKHAELTTATMSNKKILLPQNNVIFKNASQRKEPKQTTSIKNDKICTSLTAISALSNLPLPYAPKKSKKEENHP